MRTSPKLVTALTKGTASNLKMKTMKNKAPKDRKNTFSQHLNSNPQKKILLSSDDTRDAPFYPL